MSFVMSDEESRLRVVFLDDNPNMRRALVGVGAAHGISIVGVESAEDVRAALAADVDAAVLDFTLLGDQTCAQLARSLHARGAIVVVWTGNPDRARAALGEGIPVVDKSANFRELFTVLTRLVRNRAAELASFAQVWGGR